MNDTRSNHAHAASRTGGHDGAGHHHHHHHVHGSSGNLRVAFLLNLAFTVIEIIGGLWTNSIAILSDAVHDLGDTLSLGSAWYFDRLSQRGRTPRDTYGYRRYSLLGGLITAGVLVAGLSFVLWQAIGRLFDPQPVNAPGMMLLAVFGIAFNGAAVLRVRRGSSLTERVVSWHLIEDVLGWCAVLVGAGIMAVWDVPIVDPLLSIGISVFVLWNVLRALRSFLDIFLQRTPPGFDIEAFEEATLAIPGVVSVDHTHSWSVDGERHVATTHLVLRAGMTREEIVACKRKVRRLLDARTFEHVTIDVELEGEEDGLDNHRGAGAPREDAPGAGRPHGHHH
jgi:cobalt-zinc-cadmium efflux system protein